MSKTKTAEGTALAAVAATVDPRVRMKEVRQELNMFVDQKANPWGISHLGELYDDKADKTRLIIALQDKLETSDKKHRKATGHIVALLADVDSLTKQVFALNMQLMLTTAQYHQAFTMGQMVNEERNKLIKENGELLNEIGRLKAKLVAAMHTLSTSIDMGKGSL